jgi:hypothetical protein
MVPVFHILNSTPRGSGITGHIGYFQLLQEVDVFVVLDDVQMPNPGFVNRNRLLVEGHSHWFSLPVAKSSHTAPLKDRHFQLAERWTKSLQRTLEYSYAPSAGRSEASELIGLSSPSNAKLDAVVDFNVATLQATTRVLGIRIPETLRSSEIDARVTSAEERVINLCKRLQAGDYINLPGGKELYDPERFERAGIRLGFIEPVACAYPQKSAEFIPWLSILDVLASTDTYNRMRVLNSYTVSYPPSVQGMRHSGNGAQPESIP